MEQNITKIEGGQSAGAAGGKASGLTINQVSGDVNATINQIKAKLEQGDYVERQTIINLVLEGSGPAALGTIVEQLALLQRVDQQAVQNLGARAVPEHVSRQISEVVAAQQEVTAQGVQITPETAYHLGMLAAYDRKYDTALGYFRQATEADPEYSAAFAAIAWLQQSRAQDDLFSCNLDAAVAKLADAREAGAHTDPLDSSALALRGYIAKTLAQVAEARQQPAERQKYYTEAARLFEYAAQLNPGDASAQNGLGNIHYALGNLDAAIAAYRRAVTLAPSYTAAYHDLALAYEGKRQADPAYGDEWCRNALAMWRKTYELAPTDPGFSADDLLTIGKRLLWLEEQCDQKTARRKRR